MKERQNSPWLVLYFSLFVVAHIVSVALANALMAIAIIYFLIQLFKKYISKTSNDFELPKYWQLFALYALSTIVANLVNIHRVDLRDVLVEARWVLAFFGLYLMVRKFEFKEGYLKYLNWFFLLVSCYAIYQGITGHDLVRGVQLSGARNYYRTMGFSNNPIRYANVMIFPLVLLLSTMYYDFIRKKFDILKIITLLAVIISILYSGVRGVWVAIPVMVLLTAFFYGKKVLATTLIVFCLCFTAVYFSLPSVQQRVNSIVDVKDSSNSARFVLWQLHAKAWLDNFWFGIGDGDNESIAESYAKGTEYENAEWVGMHAHNMFLMTAVHFGFFALIFYLSFLGIYLFMGVTAVRGGVSGFNLAVVIFLLVALLGGLIAGVTDRGMRVSESAGFFAVSMALIPLYLQLNLENKRRL